MTLRKTLAILGLVGAVAAMVVAGTAFAQTPTPTPGPNQNRANYQSLFLDKLASALGTTRDNLNKALPQARNDTADQAVKDGNLTQAQADKLKANQNQVPFGFGFRGAEGSERGHGGAQGFMMGGADAQNAIAQALGLTPQDLQTQLRSGKTLADLAKAQGKDPQTVKDAIVNVEKPKLDQAVKDGKLTQAREDQILQGIQNSDLSKLGGGWGMMGRGGPKGHGTPNPNPTPKPSSGTAFPGAGAL